MHFDRSEDEIKNETGAVWSKRITKYFGGESRPTKTVIVAFEKELPAEIQLGLYTHKVAIYIPHPIRCGKCQRYGHPTKARKANEPVCSRCSGNHNFDGCTVERENAKCANCKQNHSAAYKGCKMFQNMSETLKIQAREGLSWSDAVKNVKINEREKQKQTELIAVASKPSKTDHVKRTEAPNAKQNSEVIAIETRSVEVQTETIDVSVQTRRARRAARRNLCSNTSPVRFTG